MSDTLLAHGWTVVNEAGVPEKTVQEFVSEPVRAVPETLAARIGACRIVLKHALGDLDFTSQWTPREDAIEIELAAGGAEPHDLALELLFCLGQAVWESVTGSEEAAWLKLLDAEIRAGVSGEIDQDALEEKRKLLSSPALASSPRRLEHYAEMSFASTLAEYVHALWHDVTVRTGPEHLPAPWLRARLELLERWFPPDDGQAVFPART